MKARVVAINIMFAETTQSELMTRTHIDLLQDLPEVGAWNLMGGELDDIFIYREGGTLAPGGRLRSSGKVPTNLSTPEGYAAVRAMVIAAADSGAEWKCADGSPPGGRQKPGDMNQDAQVNILDPVSLLWRLFLGEGPRFPCEDELDGRGNRLVLDVNQDGRVDPADVIDLLTFLFRRGSPPALGVKCVFIPGCPAACPE